MFVRLFNSVIIDVNRQIFAGVIVIFLNLMIVPVAVKTVRYRQARNMFFSGYTVGLIHSPEFPLRAAALDVDVVILSVISPRNGETSDLCCKGLFFFINVFKLDRDISAGMLDYFISSDYGNRGVLCDLQGYLSIGSSTLAY